MASTSVSIFLPFGSPVPITLPTILSTNFHPAHAPAISCSPLVSKGASFIASIFLIESLSAKCSLDRRASGKVAGLCTRFVK